MGQTRERSGSGTSADFDVNEDGTPLQSSLVQIVLVSTLLAPLGVPFLSPALPVLREVFLVSEAEASLLISAYFVIGIAFSPFIGLLVAFMPVRDGDDMYEEPSPGKIYCPG